MKESLDGAPSPDHEFNTASSDKLSRRKFLKTLGAALGALALPTFVEGAEQSPGSLSVEKGKLYYVARDGKSQAETREFLGFAAEWGIPAKDGQVFSSPQVMEAVRSLRDLDKRCKEGDVNSCRSISLQISKLRQAVRQEL